MKKYIGTKEIKAEPMNLGEFVKITGRNPYANASDMHADDEEGYIVEYEDGYRSWSPKDVFEKAYKVADTFLDRIHIERDELSLRYNRAQDFCFSSKFKDLPSNERQAFEVQLDLMRKYLSVLDARIRYAENKLNINTAKL